MSAARIVVSYRARWDLDLLPPEAADRCFDLLDRWTGTANAVDGTIAGVPLPSPLAGELAGLSYVDGEGFRIIIEDSAEPETVLIVHVLAGAQA